jgi:hypothetical protein
VPQVTELRMPGVLSGARIRPDAGGGSGWERPASGCRLRPWRSYRPPGSSVRTGGRPGPRRRHAGRGLSCGRRNRSHEHPVGSGPSRGPARGRARAVPAGDLRPVLPLDRRAASGRDRLRHARARRCAGAHRPHGDWAASATRPWGARDPPRRDQRAGGEVSRIYPARRPGHRLWDWPGDTEVVMARKPGQTMGR